MNIIKRFDNAKQVLYDHVGFKEDWVIYPIINRTEMFWKITTNQKEVRFAETKSKFISSDGQYYFNDIYTQRFYKKWVYRGKEFTMIFVDTRINGNKFFAFYSNNKEIK